MSVYLMAKYYRNPRDPKRTQEPGYLKNPDNVSWDESIAFARYCRRRDIRECNVILDLTQREVVKCSIDTITSRDFDSILGYFYRNYQRYFDSIQGQLPAGMLPVSETATTVQESEIDAHVQHQTPEVMV